MSRLPQKCEFPIACGRDDAVVRMAPFLNSIAHEARTAKLYCRLREFPYERIE